MKRLFIAAGLLAFGLFAFKNLNFVNKLEWEIKNVSASIGFFNSQLKLDVALKNNTSTVVNLESIVGVISVNNQIVVNVNYTTPLTIEAGKTTILTISTNILNTTFLTQLLQLIQNKTAIVNFKGTVNAQGLILPINYDYNFQ
jgi:hypothetical protein